MRRSLRLAPAITAFLLAAPHAATAAAAPAATGTAAPGTSPLVIVAVVSAILLSVGVVVFAVRATRSASSVEDDDGEALVESSADPAQEPADLPVAAPASETRGRRPKLAILGILAVLTVLVGYAVVEASKPRMVGDTITQEFAGGAPCATMVLPVVAPAGADPAGIGAALFEALKPVRGLKSATYDASSSSLEIGYCESESSEAAVREALQPTGLLGQATTGNTSP